VEKLRDKKRDVIHLNIADFAASVEQVVDSSLRQRPLIVAPQGMARALVYDMSEEAYQAGVRKHMALARATMLCRDAKVIAPHPHYYEKATRVLFGKIQPYSPLIEAEEDTGHLFLDLTGTTKLFGPARDVAWRLCREIKDNLGLEPIWGLATNKLLAKVATRTVKPRGERIIEPGEVGAFLEPLPLDLLPGIEPEDLAFLRELSVWQVGQAACWGLAHLNLAFGRRGPHIYRALRGQDDSPVLPLNQKPPVIRLEHEFSEDSNDITKVTTALFHLVERAGARLRRAGRVARRLVIVLYYSDGMKTVRQRSCAQGTANDFRLFALAESALKQAWLRRVRLRYLKLVCDRLAYPPAQMELFAEDRQKEQADDRLIAAMDAIRRRHGADKIKLGRTLAV
jgi:DNA polymerase-4